MRGILFSVKGHPEQNLMETALLVLEAAPAHVPAVPGLRVSGSSRIDCRVSNQSHHPQGYTQKGIWCS